GVVGAELGRHELEPDAALGAELGGPLAQQGVRRDTATEWHRLPPCGLDRPAQLRDELPDDRALKARREVGAALRGRLGTEVANRIDERRLQPAEAEVEAAVVAHRDRQRERLRVT